MKKKENRLKVSETPDFKLINEITTKNTRQEFFTAKKDYNIDKLNTFIPEKLKDEKVKGIMVIEHIYSEELEHRSNVSKYITKSNIDKVKGNIENYMNNSIFSMIMYEGYEVERISMRIIYENISEDTD